VLKDYQTLSEKLFRLSCQEISAVNNTKISRVFSGDMQIQWADGMKFDRVLLQFTDAAYYMTKPVEFISVSWPN
jgi:hypothetical protein